MQSRRASLPPRAASHGLVMAETSEHGTIVAVYDKSAAPESNVNLVMSRPAPPPLSSIARSPKHNSSTAASHFSTFFEFSHSLGRKR